MACSDCCDALNVCIGALGVAIAAFAWCFRLEAKLRHERLVRKVHGIDLPPPPISD